MNRRKMTEFGNLALIDQDAGEENGVAVPLPGVRKGEQKALISPVGVGRLLRRDKDSQKPTRHGVGGS